MFLGEDLLAYLADDPGAVRRRTEILEHVWDGHWYGATKTVDAHVAAIRKKLGDAGWIEAVRGVGGGYWFSGNAKRTTLMDVIEIFEPSLFDSAGRREPGKDTDIGRALNLVLDEINETIHATLNSISIQTMLQIKQRKMSGAP